MGLSHFFSPSWTKFFSSATHTVVAMAEIEEQANPDDVGEGSNIESFETEFDKWDPYAYNKATSTAIAATIKSTEEVVMEMKTWLRTGVAPDGSRMITNNAVKWNTDYYQVSQRGVHDEGLPKDALVDYYYWSAPYLAHIGELNLIMMHSQVNLPDGTRQPCDRLAQTWARKKSLEEAARLRIERVNRQRAAFVASAMDATANRGHPLRKDGLYTKLFWNPMYKNVQEEGAVPVS